MPRNGSGTHSIPNSFSSGTTISSSAVNANFTDIGSEITGSLPRDGQAGMTGQFQAANGTLAAPGISFGSDTNTGIYRKSGDTMGVVSGGTEVATIGSTGIVDVNANVVVGLPPGMMMQYVGTTAPTGWVRGNGRTIGNASSSATERANADTENLYAVLWNSYADAQCAVSTGRGISAAADYAANKTIALPDLRGRAFFGLDDMGNSAASRITNAGSAIVGTTNGASGGAQTATLAQTDLPNATLTATTSSDGDHTHLLVAATTTGATALTNSNQVVQTRSAASAFDYAIAGDAAAATIGKSSTNGAHTHTATTSSINGGVTQTAINKMPPVWLGTFIIKL